MKPAIRRLVPHLVPVTYKNGFSVPGVKVTMTKGGKAHKKRIGCPFQNVARKWVGNRANGENGEAEEAEAAETGEGDYT